MTYTESIPKNITTSATQKPSEPQVRIQNPFDADIFCNLIEILPNPYFATKGGLEIYVNDILVLSNKDDAFRQYAKYPLSLGKVLRRSNAIEIFAWNKTDSDEIQCDFNIHLGKELQSIPSVAIPINIKDSLDAISQSEELFALQSRANGTVETKFIDMKGYKKLILLISAASYTPPTVLVGGANVADGDLNTYGTQVFATTSTPVVAGVVDFGSIAIRKPKGRGKRTTNNTNNHYDWKLYVSNDNIAWTLVATADSGGNGSVVDLEGAQQSFRYLRLRLEYRTGDTSNAAGQCGELYDGLQFGGQAQISFEVLDLTTLQWLTLISANDIGAISQGQATTITIGDVINDAANKKFNYALPSTQTAFRAKLSITTATIACGVSIIRMS